MSSLPHVEGSLDDRPVAVGGTAAEAGRRCPLSSTLCLGTLVLLAVAVLFRPSYGSTAITGHGGGVNSSGADAAPHGASPSALLRGAFVMTPVDLYVIILTHGTNTSQPKDGPATRDAIRNGILRTVDTRVARMAYFFIMTPPNTTEGLALLAAENASWGDIVYTPYSELDLAHKTWAGIVLIAGGGGVGGRLPRYVAKLDTDSFVRYDRLLPRLAQFIAAGGEGGGGGGFATRFYWGRQAPWSFWARSNYVMSGDVAAFISAHRPHGFTFKDDGLPRMDEDVVIGEMASSYVNRIMLNDELAFQQFDDDNDATQNCTLLTSNADYIIMHETGRRCMREWAATPGALALFAAAGSGEPKSKP